MSEMKVYELAKDLGITSSDLIAVLREVGVAVTGGSSALDASTADTVREMLAQDSGLIEQAKTIEVPQSLPVRELAEASGSGRPPTFRSGWSRWAFWRASTSR